MAIEWNHLLMANHAYPMHGFSSLQEFQFDEPHSSVLNMQLEFITEPQVIMPP